MRKSSRFDIVIFCDPTNSWGELIEDLRTGTAAENKANVKIVKISPLHTE
jgi:hypothetical protein